MPDGSIRKMQLYDIEGVVRTHLEAFPGFFLSFLGSLFLSELYQSILSDLSGIAYIYENEQIMGFVAGTSQPAGFYRRIIRSRWWRFSLASLRTAIRYPKIIPRLVRALQMPEKSTALAGEGTIMSIAVLPECQGKGIGKALVHVFLLEAAQRGLKGIDLTTDRLGNESVNYFYQKLGFVLRSTFITPEGREMNEYFIEI